MLSFCIRFSSAVSQTDTYVIARKSTPRIYPVRRSERVGELGDGPVPTGAGEILGVEGGNRVGRGAGVWGGMDFLNGRPEPSRLVGFVPMKREAQETLHVMLISVLARLLMWLLR